MASLLSERTIGVMGSGEDEHQELPREVGKLLAQLGVNLLTGAGGGVMAAVSRAYRDAPKEKGICIGIVPCSELSRATTKSGYPNNFIELAIRTHLPHSGKRGKEITSRNHINVLTSD